jgi:hypothetical protein
MKNLPHQAVRGKREISQEEKEKKIGSPIIPLPGGWG